MLYLIVLPKPGASGQHAAVHGEGAGQVGSGGQEHATADDQEEQGPASERLAGHTAPAQHWEGRGRGACVQGESERGRIIKVYAGRKSTVLSCKTGVFCELVLL